MLASFPEMTGLWDKDADPVSDIVIFSWLYCHGSWSAATVIEDGKWVGVDLNLSS